MKQADRRRDARRKLTSAVVECLDRFGYAQTTITTVQQAAGVSRGAVLHHFPSKLELIAGTARALLSSALERTQSPPKVEGVPLEEQVLDYWRNVVDTRAGRAFVEILAASRSDAELREAVDSVLFEFENELTVSAFERMIGEPVVLSAGEVEALWGVSRAFLRGMLLETRDDPERAERRVRLFARMLTQVLAVTPET